MSASAQWASGARIARAAERAVLGDDRGDARRQQCGVGLGRPRPDAGTAGRERRQAQEHQRADDLALDLGPGPRGVAADQAALQLGAALGRDVAQGERAEAGRDAVVRALVADEGVDDRTGAGDLGEGVRPEGDGRPVAGDGDDV
jgi:hypothetical protein